MKPHILVLLSLVTVLILDPVRSKTVGNDIIVNIGQTNGNNHNNGYGKPSVEASSPTQSGSGYTPPSATPTTAPVKLPNNNPAASPAPSNSPKETICSANGMTMQVEASAVQGHLQAGAKLGACVQSKAPSRSAAPPTPAPSTTSPSTIPPSSTAASPAPSSVAPKNETAEPQAPREDRVPICLPHVNTTILIAANTLGPFLAKGATIGNCTASPTPVQVTAAPTPAPTTSSSTPRAPIIIQPSPPTLVVQSRPIQIAADECVTPTPATRSRSTISAATPRSAPVMSSQMAPSPNNPSRSMPIARIELL